METPMHEDEVLCYATPYVPILARREGEFLVVQATSVLPGRCVFCNGEAGGGPVRIVVPTSKSFQLKRMEDRPAFSVGNEFIVLQASFCTGHLRFRRLAGVMTVVLTIALLADMFTIFRAMKDYLDWPRASDQVMLACAIPIFALIVGCTRVVRRGLRYSHTKGGHVYLTGAGKDFLDGLAGHEVVGATERSARRV